MKFFEFYNLLVDEAVKKPVEDKKPIKDVKPTDKKDIKKENDKNKDKKPVKKENDKDKPVKKKKAVGLFNIVSSFKNPKELRDFLKTRIVYMKFVKLGNDDPAESGKIRPGYFTRDLKLIPKKDHPKGTGVPGPDYQVKMWDMQLKEWRSCVFNNIEIIKLDRFRDKSGKYQKVGVEE